MQTNTNEPCKNYTSKITEAKDKRPHNVYDYMNCP